MNLQLAVAVGRRAAPGRVGDTLTSAAGAAILAMPRDVDALAVVQHAGDEQLAILERVLELDRRRVDFELDDLGAGGQLLRRAARSSAQDGSQ